MAGTIPNTGEVHALNLLCNKATPSDLLLKLFSNDVTPAEGVVSFTEVTGGGYAAKTLNGAAWTVTGADPTTAVTAAQTFTLTAARTAYGYYLETSTGGIVVGYEEFSDGPYVTPAGGGTITVTPTLSAT